MLKSLFDGVMERRAQQLIEQVRAWLPSHGPLLDLGSGTGHLSAAIERELGVEVITADVTDMHVTGRPPLLITNGRLPFEAQTFSSALLLFMLAYPADPTAVLAEARRVSHGRIILVQTVYRGLLGQAWHRGREFVWTVVAFHVSKMIGYVSADARFTMYTQRFYTTDRLAADVAAAGLRIVERRERAVLPGNALVVAAWLLEHDD